MTTVRELAQLLSNMSEELQELPVMTMQFNRYEPLRLDSHPIVEIGYFHGEQYVIIRDHAYSTRAFSPTGPQPTVEQLNLRQKVFTL